MKTDRTLAIGLRAAMLAGLVGVALAGNAAQAQPPRREPPPIAFAACEGREDGAACSVSLPGHTIEGTCRAAEDRRLFCLPAHMPPPPEGAAP